MKLKNILIAVSDLQKSKEFYKKLFGLDVVQEQDGNLILTEGLVLQDEKSWEDCLEKELLFYNHTTELYFEEPDMDGFVKKLENYEEEVEYVTPRTDCPWGQQMVRIYDPDGHLIEVRTPQKG